MCAVQHEPPCVPLTTRPNSRPALGMESTSTRHPEMGHLSAALLLGCCRASLMHLQPWGESPAWPQWDWQLPVLPEYSMFGISSCGIPGSTNPLPVHTVQLTLFLQEI